MRLDIKASFKNAERSLGNLRAVAPIAASRAINLAITKAASAAVKSIAAEVGLKQSTVRALLMLRKSSRNNLRALVAPKSGRRIPLIEMQARQTKKGISYKSRGRRQTIRGAFIARMKSGRVGAFKRVHYGEKSPNIKGQYWGDIGPNGKRYFSQLPIVEMLGPSLPKLFVQRHIESAIDEAARATYGKELDRQVALLLKRGGA